jgi:rSAM/selenodomain-associated transferase 2
MNRAGTATAAGPLRLSVVIPALNEEDDIAATVRSAIAPAVAEIIVVDGGSEDDTRAIAERAGARVVASARGRARQLNAGAAATRGDVLLFLHADTRLPRGFDRAVAAALSDAQVAGGRFDIDLQPSTPLIWLTARLISARSRLSRIATGDQALFVRRAVFEAIGGFPDQPIMEDLAFSIALKRRGGIACLRERVISSSRRWRKDGVVRTILLMWGLRFLYFCGVSPARLRSFYADTR